MTLTDPNLELEPAPRGFPPIVLLWMGALSLAYLAYLAAPEVAKAAAAWRFSVIPLRFESASIYAYPGLTETVTALVGHAFLHAGLLHLFLNVMFLGQGGAPLARRFGEGRGGGLRFSALFILSTVLGALTYVLFNPSSDIRVVGASGGVSGVFAAFFLSLRPNWRDSLRLPFARNGILVFLAVNVGLAALGRGFGVPIAWEAHLGGFFAGLLLQPLLAPRTAYRII